MKKLALILTLALFIASCGKKDETQTTPPQDQQQMTQTQQQTQQKTDDQVKQDKSKKDEMKIEDDKKKEDEKKKEDDKKKTDTKDESIRKTDNVSKTNDIPDTRSDIDFSPIFAKKCAKCHGKNLKGKPDGGPDLTRSETQNKSDSKLFNIITTGVKADNEDDEDMPSFKNKLSNDEIKAAVEFIKKH